MKTLFRFVIPVALVVLLALAGCGAKAASTAPTSVAAAPGTGTTLSTPVASVNPGVSSADTKSYHPTWLTPKINGDQVSLSVAEIIKDKMVHFWMTLPSGKEAFMAYRLDGVTYVRADICVPCRSTSFSLEKGVLVCDTCGTRFDAKTGAGISGACKNYPKDEAKTEVSGDNLTVTTTALAAAYESTLQPG
jgi:nitrite reductase/ring-hydroxylating ferredoxin subunit/predicted small lipoprotein YifL